MDFFGLQLHYYTFPIHKNIRLRKMEQYMDRWCWSDIWYVTYGSISTWYWYWLRSVPSLNSTRSLFTHSLTIVHQAFPPTGQTGHAEVVRVVFFPAKISFSQLLKVFWENHNPTQGTLWPSTWDCISFCPFLKTHSWYGWNPLFNTFRLIFNPKNHSENEMGFYVPPHLHTH